MTAASRTGDSRRRRDAPRPDPPHDPQASDIVDEASRESFPASDAPAFTPTSGAQAVPPAAAGPGRG